MLYSLIGVINNLKKYDNQFLDSLENINTSTNQLIIKTNQFFDELKFNYEEIYSNLDFNRYDINISNENFLMNEFKRLKTVWCPVWTPSNVPIVNIEKISLGNCSILE